MRAKHITTARQIYTHSLTQTQNEFHKNETFLRADLHAIAWDVKEYIFIEGYCW